MSIKLRNLIADYAYWQAELASDDCQSLDDVEVIRANAEKARKDLQDQLEYITGNKFRFPKNIIRSRRK